MELNKPLGSSERKRWRSLGKSLEAVGTESSIYQAQPGPGAAKHNITLATRKLSGPLGRFLCGDAVAIHAMWPVGKGRCIVGSAGTLLEHREPNHLKNR
jgi:hypothetical protein